MSSTRQRRTKYLVDKKAQARFVLVIIVSFIVHALFLLWNVHDLLVSVMPKGVVVVSMQHIIIFITGSLVIAILASSVIVKYTHVIFGPVPRLKKELAGMAEKNEYYLLRIREKDSLGELIDNMNLLIEKFIIRRQLQEQEDTHKEKSKK